MNEKKYKVSIVIISVAVPVLIAWILFSSGKWENSGSWTSFLPHLNAVINSATTIVLLTGFAFIKNGKKDWHKMAMTTAFFLGVIFLISYIIYHSTSTSIVYGDQDGNGVLDQMEADQIGFSRTFYLILLLSHILLAAVVVPFVLLAFYYALTSNFDRHKKVVKFTLPIWLYVSITGVGVYLMISQFY